jgi:hypothetical protein
LPPALPGPPLPHQGASRKKRVRALVDEEAEETSDEVRSGDGGAGVGGSQRRIAQSGRKGGGHRNATPVP